MIRPAAMVLGFIGSTLALLWALGRDADPVGTPDQVSRAAPDMMSLQPALSPVAPQAVVGTPVSDQFRPVARPVALPPKAVPVPAEQAQAAPRVIATAPGDKVSGAIEAMGYGILEELKKPATPRTVPDGSIQQAAVVQPETAPASATARTYTVQPGDSLPGIAFRFFGTTVAYLQILDANQDVLRDPAQLRAGMVLTIPE